MAPLDGGDRFAYEALSRPTVVERLLAADTVDPASDLTAVTTDANWCQAQRR